MTFTTEIGEGEEEWLATLDTEIRMEPDNTISYRQYEKPTTTNTVVMKRSALEENSKSWPMTCPGDLAILTRGRAGR